MPERRSLVRHEDNAPGMKSGAGKRVCATTNKGDLLSLAMGRATRVTRRL